MIYVEFFKLFIMPQLSEDNHLETNLDINLQMYITTLKLALIF